MKEAVFERVVSIPGGFERVVSISGRLSPAPTRRRQEGERQEAARLRDAMIGIDGI